MTLAQIRDMTASLNIAEENHVYMGKLDDKLDKSIGVYNSKRERPLLIPLGGRKNSGYGVKLVSFLVHWNKSPRETENVSQRLSDVLNDIRNQLTNASDINYILASNPIDIGIDDKGIYEMVIEADIYYKERKE